MLNFATVLPIVRITNMNWAKEWAGVAIENQRGQRIRCQEWLKPLNVKAIHDSQQRLEGTCEWIWTNPNFLQWSTCSSSQASNRVLCIYGPPGCGKSVLASSLAEGFQRKQCTTLFYSFSGMEVDRRSTKGLVCTLLWQLLQDSSDERRLGIVLNLIQNGPPGIGNLWDTFKQVVALVPGQVYCIIDGTDECSDPTLEFLDRICEVLATRESTHAILLGRPRDLQNALSSTATAIEITSEIVKHDIEKFIDTRIQQSTIPTLPGDLEETVSRTLKSKSDCMFLWAKLMVDELSRSSTPFHVRERLRNLPRGLEDAYRYLLLQLFKRLDPLDIDLAQRVLAFTTAACRTMDLKEVQYACALDSLSTSADSTLDDHLLPYPEKTILDVCGDFISIRDGQVRFVHFSVKEFLTRPESEWLGENDRRIVCFRVDVESSHQRLGSTCLDFLTTGDYASPAGDSSYEGVMARCPFLMYSSAYMITHLGQFGTPCPATLTRLWEFIRSEKGVSWMEYAGVVHMESCSFGMLLEDVERMLEWPGGEQLDCLPALFRRELARRVREFGEHDPCTDRWRLIVETFQPLEPNLPVPLPESDKTPTVILGPQHIPEAVPQDITHIIDGLGNNLVLPLDQKVNMVLGLKSYLSRINVLTDPLKILFHVILRNASTVPIYGLISIAGFYVRVNKLEEALEVYSAALKRTEGRELRIRPWVLDMVGDILSSQGKYKDAEATYERALKEGEKVFGVGHANTLVYASDLAISLYHLHRFAEAEVLGRRVLAGREKILGADHPDTLNSAYNLAISLYRLDKFAEAEVLYRRALAGREKTLGADHPDTLNSAYNLAISLYRLGKFAEAEVLDRRVLAGREKILRADHPDTLNSASNLAISLYRLDKFAEAEVLDRRALAEWGKTLGADHLDTLDSAHKLAISLCGLGKFAEAEVLYRRVLAGMEKTLCADHPDTLNSAYNLAISLYRLGKFAEAEVLYRRVLAGREKILGADHPDTLN